MTWLDDLVLYASLRLDDRGREALYARGVTDEQIALFGLGYLDRDLPGNVDFPGDFLKWAHRGSKLDDVFVLPLTNALGEIRGVQFRHVERERAGYMDYILRTGEAVLFGLAQAMPHIWGTGRIWIVEGGFDLFPIQRQFPATIATLTARLVEPLVRVLRRLVTEIWLGYDMDKTGRTKSEQIVKQHGAEFTIHNVHYPVVVMADGKSSKDPSDLWEAWGDPTFATFVRELLDRTTSPMERFNA